MEKTLSDVDAEDLVRKVSAAVTAVMAKETTGLQILSYIYINDLVELVNDCIAAQLPYLEEVFYTPDFTRQPTEEAGPCHRDKRKKRRVVFDKIRKKIIAQYG
ncbi:hypothetical protein F2P81_004967 [Scophthalmus maximus]|uniref:Uncharacterized protein n=1 Tax=Scophthalmus maximus TaxID=52904 RepID=A0A6A4TIU0_SCOMX|nr:hypothetical protein F2P81_004967 [Scophthalmus maximus]